MRSSKQSYEHLEQHKSAAICARCGGKRMLFKDSVGKLKSGKEKHVTKYRCDGCGHISC